MANFTPQQIEEFLREFFDVVGTRQYIGARYVPIFGRKGEEGIDWDGGAAPYDPLTIVLYQGNSFTSRTYVPAGVDITDTAYWVQTGLYDAQVEAYREEVRQVVEDMGELRTETDEAMGALQESVALEARDREEGDAAVRTALTNLIHDDYVPLPVQPDSKYGTQSQVLATKGNGSTEWVDPIQVTPEVAGPIIEEWLDEHPEATTTIEDGAVTTAKIADGAVTDAKIAPTSGILSGIRYLNDMVPTYQVADVPVYSQLIGWYPSDSTFTGFGTRVLNPRTVLLSASFRVDVDVVVIAELLDASMNVVFTAELSATVGNNTLPINVDTTALSDYLWLRIRSKLGGAGVQRANFTRNGLVPQDGYSTYYVGGEWRYANGYGIAYVFEIEQKSATRVMSVGDGMEYPRLVDAVEECGRDSWVIWKNVIELHDDVDLYTELGGSTWYTGIDPADGNMQGLEVPDNTVIRGIGDVTVSLVAPDEYATTNNVPNLSVLEVGSIGECWIEDLTIVGKNVRYGVHDESDGNAPGARRHYRNVTIDHQGVVSGTWSSPVAYGCGASSGMTFEYDNCTFTKWLAHPAASQTVVPEFVARDCRFNGGAYAMSLNTSGSGTARLTMIGCVVDSMCRALEDTNAWQVFGYGNADFPLAIIGSVYNQNLNHINDKTLTAIAGNNITRLKAVTLNDQGRMIMATSRAEFMGVSTGNIETGKMSTIACHGYVNVYDFLAVQPGTLVGVDSNGDIVADSTNPIGKVVSPDGIKQLYLF